MMLAHTEWGDHAKSVLALLIVPAVAMAQDDASDAHLLQPHGSGTTLKLDPVAIEFEAPSEIEEISAITADAEVNLYILQRARRWTRSWLPIPTAECSVVSAVGCSTPPPHGIRIDPDGSVWTVDSNTSMVYKYSLVGKQLLEIAVGDICPNPQSESRTASDIAFGTDGHVYVAECLLQRVRGRVRRIGSEG